MTCLQKVCVVTLPFVIGILWMFSGVLETHYEHDVTWEFFIKQHPSSQIIYWNPAECGECDVQALDSLTQSRLSEFASYCLARYDLGVRECHAISREGQQMIYEAEHP